MLYEDLSKTYNILTLLHSDFHCEQRLTKEHIDAVR